MRKKYLFGTFKNKLDVFSAFDVLVQNRSNTARESGHQIGVAPSAICLAAFAGLDHGYHLAAQNVGWSDSYSLTGEINADDLVHYGIGFCIIAHSERRLHLNEDERIIEKRLAECFKKGIRPILCIGETLEQYEAEQTSEVLTRQLATLSRAAEALGRPATADDLLVAYEPMWAISTSGSGKTLNAEIANDIHAAIRGLIDQAFGRALGDEVSLLYGGSVNKDNGAEYFAMPHIDGGLVGSGMQSAEGFAAVSKDFQAHC